MAETFNVTQTTTLTTDNDGDGQFDPGDGVTTTVTIANQSTTTDATGVQFTETLNGMTLVANSIQVTPIAFDDSGAGFTLTGNTPMTFTAAQLLGNDIDPDGAEANLVIQSVSGATNGTAVLNLDGSVTFTPNVGYEGAAQFEYTVRDEDGLDSVTTGTVSLTVNDPVWYVNAATGNDTTGDGTFANPFASLAPLTTGGSADGLDDANDIIFVTNNGSYTNSGIVLENGQQLLGDGSSLTTVNGLAVGASAGNTAISNNGGVLVTLAQNNTVSGVDLGNSSTAISGNNFGTVNVSAASINTNGTALNLTTGTVAGTGFTSTSSTGGTNNVSLTGVDGTVNLGSGALSGATGASFNVSGGAANIDYNGSITHSNNAAAINVASHTGGTISFDGAVTSNGNSDGINLTNNGGTTINFTNTLTINTSASGTTGFNATGGGTVSATGSGSTINSGTGTALNIANTNIGASDLTFQSISSSGGSATGIILDTTGSLGGLHVTSTGGAGSGGTIANKTGADGSTTTGIGVYLNNTADVQLDQMQLNGFENFAIRASDVNGFSLQNSVINGNNGNSAGADEGAILFLNSSGTINIANSQISGGFEDNLRVLYDSATADTAVYNITNNDFTDLQSGNNALVNLRSATTASASSNVTFNFGSTSDPALGNTFDNSANQNPLPPPDTQWFGDGILVTFEGPFQHNINIDNNTFNELFQAIDFAANFSADVNARIYNNTITYTEGVGAIAFGTGSSSTASMLFQMLIEDNDIGGLGNDSGSRLGSGIVGDFRGAETARVTIHQNVVRDTEVNPVNIISQMTLGQDGDTHLRITNNTIASIDDDEGGGAGVIPGINVTTNAATNGDIFLTISGNISTGINEDGILVRQATANNTFQLEDFAGNGTVAADVDAYLEAQNPGTTARVRTGGSVVDYGTMNQNNTNTPAPVTPLLAAEGGVEAANATPTDDTTNTNDTPDAGADPQSLPPDDEPAPVATDPQPAPAHEVIVDDGVLTQAELDTFVDAAIARWSAAGLTEAQLDALEAMSFGVADMSGLNLGSFSPEQITLDSDGAGWGWFLDPTPGDDAEFGNIFSATRMWTDPASAPAGHYDLLTTVMHEMGHALGLEDDYTAGARDDLMYGWLFLGERRLPGEGDADGAVAGSITSEEFLGSPVVIGVLPFGKSVQVSWQATINNQSNQLIVDPQNTGQVTATNGVGFPDTNSNTVTTTLDTLTLGFTPEPHVWNDNGAGGGIAGNGILDGTELGIDGVALTLFADTGTTAGVWDASDTQIATTTTGGGGNYAFTGLAPGDYIVRVDLDNFDAGGNTSLVATQVSSAGNPDPDNNVDHDDNGSRLAGQAAFSQAITLAYNTEPTNGVGNDTNGTLDFGFFAAAAPTDLTGALAVNEFAANGTAAGTLTAVDADSVTFNYTLTDNAGGRFAINLTTGQVTVVNGLLLDFEQNASHNITVQVDDLTGGIYSEIIAVTINDINPENVTGDGAPNTFVGGALADTLNGAGNNDILDGGGDADTLSGGTGDDVYVVDNAGDQTIENANEGYDTVRSTINYQLSVNVEVLELQGNADLIGWGHGGHNDIYGNTGNNRLYGDHDEDTLVGFGGDDYLDGATGGDAMYGGAGHDLLHGGDGNDLLKGGADNDRLYGAEGDDIFFFEGLFGNDTIGDFIAGAGVADVIRLDDAQFADFAAVLAATNDDGLGNTVISHVAGSITVTGVLKAQFNIDDFQFV